MAGFTLRTKAWMGDGEDTFPCPPAWDVTEYHPRDREPLDDAGLAQALASPIGTPRIAQVARGKGSAVIIVDDLSRPTPAWRVAPLILDELKEAGVPDDGIRFVVGGGAHRPLTGDEIAKKVGRDVAARYVVLNHDSYSGKLVGMGNLEDGTPIYLNPVVAESEVKIGLAGIYPHPSAGLGGGAKIVLPGVVGIATIAYNHGLFKSRGRGIMQSQGQDRDMRENMERVARHIGLDVIVNTVLNSRREVAGLFVGDVVQAHQEGVAFARQVYGTPIPQSDVSATDIVFINAYPLDYDPVQLGKSSWPVNVFQGAYKVMINAASDGIRYHGLSDRMDYGRYRMLRQNPPKVDIPARPAIRSKDPLIVLSEGFKPEDYYERFAGGALFTSWSALVAELERLCPSAKVAVIPCSAIQLPELV